MPTLRESHAFALSKTIDAMSLVKEIATLEINPKNHGRTLFQLVDLVQRAKEIQNRRLEKDNDAESVDAA